MSLLTEEPVLIQDTARQVAGEVLLPNAARWERDAQFPRQALEEVAAGDGACSKIMKEACMANQRRVIARRLVAS